MWDKIKDKEKWSCNSIYKIMPYLPDKEIWVDKSFFKHECSNLQKLHKQGVKLASKEYHRLAGLSDCIDVYGSTRDPAQYYGKKAVEKKLIFYGRMGLCGHFALSLAIGFGYDEIFLLGYDFGTKKKQDRITHVHQNRISELNIHCTGAGRPEVYLLPGDVIKTEVEDFEVNARTEGVNIWNVSLESNIPYFPKITYDDFFKMIGDKDDSKST